MGRLEKHIRISSLFYVVVAAALILLPLRWIFACFIAVFIHELAHFVAVMLFGGSICEISISIFGAKMTTTPLPNEKEMICALAGPAGGFFLLLLKKYIPVIAFCATIHSIFNLLPLAGFDGGRMLSCFLGIFLKRDYVCRICEWTDRIIRILLFFGVLLVSWKLSWWALAIMGTIFCLGRFMWIKIPCKPGPLQVQ